MYFISILKPIWGSTEFRTCSSDGNGEYSSSSSFSNEKVLFNSFKWWIYRTKSSRGFTSFFFVFFFKVSLRALKKRSEVSSHDQMFWLRLAKLNFSRSRVNYRSYNMWIKFAPILDKSITMESFRIYNVRTTLKSFSSSKFSLWNGRIILRFDFSILFWTSSKTWKSWYIVGTKSFVSCTSNSTKWAPYFPADLNEPIVFSRHLALLRENRKIYNVSNVDEMEAVNDRGYYDFWPQPK